MMQPKIVMYVREDCYDVVLARRVLESRRVVWQEIDIDHDAAAREQVVAWTGRAATPTIWIGELMLVEPGARELLEALEDASTVSAS